MKEWIVFIDGFVELGIINLGMLLMVKVLVVIRIGKDEVRVWFELLL